MNDRNICCEHDMVRKDINGVELWVIKLDNRLWIMIYLLVANLIGIIGLLLTALLTA
jgi:hypothetical protein